VGSVVGLPFFAAGVSPGFLSIHLTTTLCSPCQPSLGMQAVGAYCIIRSRRPAPSLMCGSTSLKHLPHMWQHVHVCVEGGWCCCLLSQCFCESRWAMLTKEFDFALDLGKADGNGEGPRCHRTGLHQGRRTEAADDAERFRGQELKAKSFTNGKEDRPMVGELYRGAFEKEMGEITDLNYNRLGWGDEEMVLVSKVIASGAMAQLKALYLAENQIGDEGMKSFSTALASGVMAQLEILVLGGNQIGDEGMKSFATTLATHKHSSGV
jgi:hypothetical protein